MNIFAHGFVFNAGVAFLSFLIHVYIYTGKLLRFIFIAFVPFIPFSPNVIKFINYDDTIVFVNIKMALMDDNDITNWTKWMLWIHGNDYTIFSKSKEKNIVIYYDTVTYCDTESYHLLENKIMFFKSNDLKINIINSKNERINRTITFKQLFE
jgi:hypothetical protein